MNVIWWNGSRGNWDHGMLMDVFNKHPEVFDQRNEHHLQHDVDRAIVIVTGNPNPQSLYEFLQTLNSGLVILTSDEEARWDITRMIPSHLKIWTQYWREGMHPVDHKILMGYPSRLHQYKINKHLPKKYLWSFVGQVQNPFRQACIDVLKTLPNGFLQTVELFGGIGDGAMEYQDYLDIICQSHFVICPAGSFSVESFRFYEAMECGAIPITDARSPKYSENFDFWSEVVNPFNGIVSIKDWSELPFLLDVTDKNADRINAWWVWYKQQFEQKLLDYANSPG